MLHSNFHFIKMLLMTRGVLKWGKTLSLGSSFHRSLSQLMLIGCEFLPVSCMMEHDRSVSAHVLVYTSAGVQCLILASFAQIFTANTQSPWQDGRNMHYNLFKPIIKKTQVYLTLNPKQNECFSNTKSFFTEKEFVFLVHRDSHYLVNSNCNEIL